MPKSTRKHITRYKPTILGQTVNTGENSNIIITKRLVHDESILQGTKMPYRTGNC